MTKATVVIRPQSLQFQKSAVMFDLLTFFTFKSQFVYECAFLNISPDSLRISGLATVTAAVKSLPLYSVSNCQVTNWDCWVYSTISIRQEYRSCCHKTLSILTLSMECQKIQKEKQVLESNLKHRPSSHTLGKMQQSVSVQTTR